MTSFKLFMAYPGVFMLDDASIFRAMRQAGDSGALIMMHAENGGPIDVLVRQFLDEGKTEPLNHGLTRPAVMEGEAVHRVFKLAELAEHPRLHRAPVLARRAERRPRGARPRACPRSPRPAPSTCTCRSTTWRGRGSRARSSCARRRCGRPTTRRSCGRACAATTSQVVSTDHAPFNYVGQKDLGKDDFSKIPNGLPSVEDRFTLLYGGVEAGHIGLNRFVELVATAPAKMFGLYPRKGTIAPGSDADIVVFDPRRTSARSRRRPTT